MHTVDIRRSLRCAQYAARPLMRLLSLCCARCAADRPRGCCLLHQVKGVSPAASPQQQEALLEAAAPFQNAYLAGSLQRMSDAVGAAFPGGNRALPTAADLQKCIGCLDLSVTTANSGHRTCTAVHEKRSQLGPLCLH